MGDSSWDRLVVVVASAGLAGSCASTPATNVVSPSYDTYTGRLIQLSADQDGDGRTDQWTYLDGNLPLRGEKDADQDGRIDRWEYFSPQGDLVTIGTSSRNDGVEDTWTWVGRVNGEGRVDLSLARDRHIDKREYYVGDVLAHAEIDTNADGRTDRWDRYENRVLREVQFDTTFQAARADRRLLYGPQGHFVAAEADDDRDGRFERLSPGTTVVPPGGAIK